MGRVISVPSFRLVAVGFLAVAVILALFIWGVGLGEVLTALRSAKLWVLPLILGVSICWLVLWSQSLGTVLTLLGVAHTRPIMFLTYLGIVFSNNVTPFAQAGAEPLAALVVSRTTDVRYEVSLSAVASVDALNVFPSVGLATVSLLYFALKTTLDPRIEVAAILFISLSVLTTVFGVVVWRKRASLGGLFRRVTSRVGPILERRERQSTRLGQLDIGARAAEFTASLERLSQGPRELVLALVFSTGGWLCLVTALWGSIYAIGYVVPFEVSMLVVPLGLVASLTPLPGGAGGIEAAYIFLLSLLTPVPIASITAAVLVFRAATYLFPVIAGGGAIAILSFHRRDSEIGE